MFDYLLVILESIDWSQIVLGLILAALSALTLWARKRRKEIAKWWVARRERREAHEALPQAVATMAKSVETLLQSNVRTTTQFGEISSKLDTHTTTLDNQNKMLADISAMSHGQMELDSVARFICDEMGRNRYVNTAYARMLRCGRDELDAYGYQRFFLRRDNERYLSGFFDAAKQHRTYEAETIVTRSDDTKFLARVRIVPHPEDVPPATHWNGMVVFIREIPTDGP